MYWCFVNVHYRRHCKASATKTIKFVVKSANQADVIKLADRVVVQPSTVCAEESSAYDHFMQNTIPGALTIRLNSTDDGVSNNMTKNHFARFRRMQYGQRRWPNGKNLYSYFNQVCTNKNAP